MMQNTVNLVMPDGVRVTSTANGYESDDMPELARLLNCMYPKNGSPRIAAERVGRRYGWRVEAVLRDLKPHEGAGV
jgi:hypothetical protein